MFIDWNLLQLNGFIVNPTKTDQRIMIQKLFAKSFSKKCFGFDNFDVCRHETTTNMLEWFKHILFLCVIKTLQKQPSCKKYGWISMFIHFTFFKNKSKFKYHNRMAMQRSQKLIIISIFENNF